MSTLVSAKIRSASASPTRIIVVLTEHVAWQNWQYNQRVTYPFPGSKTLDNHWRAMYEPETATLRLSVDDNAGIEPLEAGRWARVEIGQGLGEGFPRSEHVEPVEPDDVYYVRAEEVPSATAVPSRTPADPQRPTKEASDNSRTPARSTRRAFDPATRAALLVVLAGFGVLLVLGIVSIIVMAVSDTTLSAVASVTTGAFGVIGSIAGAFFGIHAGRGQTSASDDRHAIEVEKAQMLATMVAPDKADDARRMIAELHSSAGRED